MTWFLVFLATSVVFIGLLTLTIYGVGQAIKKLANRPVKRFFTTVPTPATFVFQVLEGRVVRVIENVTSWRLDDEDRFVIDKTPKKFGFWENLGVIWIGLFSTIKVFEKWHWPEFRQTKKQVDGKEVVKYEVTAREKDVTEFYFQFPYSVLIEDIELAGNIRANLNAVFTVFFLNPVRAIFLNKDPVDLFIAMARSGVRAWMANKIFDVIKQITVSGNKSANQIPEFWNMLEELNGIKFLPDGNPDYQNATPDGMYGKLGVAIVRVELEQIEAVGKAAEAIEAKKIAELQGDADIVKKEKAAKALKIEAVGKKAAMDILTEANRNRIEKNIVGPTGGPGVHVTNVLVAEQFANPDSNVTVLGGNVMVSVPAEPKKAP